MLKLPRIVGFLVTVIVAILVTGMTHQAHAERVALVVGNAQYDNVAPLSNPRNDAEAISAVLRELGFKVFDGYDLTRSAFEDLIRNFARGAHDAETALFYYAGHGLEVGSVNYLIPTDAKISDETDLKFETINLNDVLGFMERAQRTNLIFLDACRDNPMARNLSLNMGTRSVAVGRGLAPVDTGVGTMIAYSTQPGNVALDGDMRHSPFTEALLDHIATPKLDVEIMMRRVRRDVMQETGGQQVPWSSSSLTGSFVFQLSPDYPPAESAKPQPAASVPPETVRDPVPEAALAVLGPIVPVTPPDDSSAALRTEPPSTRDLARKAQSELNRLGCNAGVEDGIWGRNSKDALTRLAKYAPLSDVSELDPSEVLLDQMEGLSGGICPLVCRATENLIDGACIQKTCGKGQRLSSKGQCYTPQAAKPRQRSSSNSRSNCFTFDGATYCE
ncbi:MAG: caspase domain-containing protein [Sulfitobacter sp.]